MQTLTSYVQGRWHAGTGASVTLYNPTTEAPLAVASSGGTELGRDPGGQVILQF